MCDDDLIRELQRIKAENQELRRAADPLSTTLHERASELADEVRRLREENARLREELERRSRPPMEPPYRGQPRWKTPVIFDFDGVLAEAIWPDPGIGEPIEAGVELLQDYLRRGYRVMVWTSRHWDQQQEIEDWLLGVIGEHIPVLCGKPLAALYIDDRAWRFE